MEPCPGRCRDLYLYRGGDRTVHHRHDFRGYRFRAARTRCGNGWNAIHLRGRHRHGGTAFCGTRRNTGYRGTWSPALAGAGTYTYTVAATAPCTTDETSEVTVSERPAPDAIDDIFNIKENTILNGDVSTNDIRYSVTKYTIINTPFNGTISLATDGTFKYTPNQHFNGSDVFSYRLKDSGCGTDVAFVSITVKDETDEPPIIPILSIDFITLDNVVNKIESSNPITITGTVSGNFMKGDIVILTVNDLQYEGAVDINGIFSVLVPGAELRNDSDTMVRGIITISSTTANNTGTATSNRDYDTDTDSPSVDSFVTSNPFPVLTGQGNRNETLTVDVDINEDGTYDFTFVVVTDAEGLWTIATDIKTSNTNPFPAIDNKTILSIRATDGAGNRGLGEVIVAFENDRDADGLPDAEENKIGTDSDNPDTDGDGINDGKEIQDGTNPLDPCDSIGGTPPPSALCDLFVELDLIKPGDIINGNFKITNIERFPDNHVEFYNRWGNLVWETSGYDNSSNAFDGVSKGRITVMTNQKLPSGVYFYEIKYVADGMDKYKNGYMYIIR